MKYIRTKEGNIYQRFFKDKSIRGVGRSSSSCCDRNLNPLGETIIKESDNLEELCDEFVIEYADKKHDLMQKLRWAELEEYNASLVGNGGTIYGAIWTDKGLIYVAKLNSEGELELI